MRIGRLAACLALPVLAACSTLEMSPDTRLHMIGIDENGAAHTIRVGDRVYDDEDLEEHIEQIVEHVRESGKKRVLLFIHGGLVSKESALRAVEENLAKMKQQDFYPIFVNWETGIGKSYLDHLFFVREGERSVTAAVLTSPLYLVADFGRALARYPVNLAFLGREAVANLVVAPDVTLPPEGWNATARLEDWEQGVTIGERAETFVLGVVPGAARLGTTPFLDGVGRSAFINMQRRARVLFLLDEDHGAQRRRVSGALSLLMNGLRGVRNESRDVSVLEIEYEIRRLKARLEVNRALHPRHPPEEACSFCGDKDDLLTQLEAKSQELRDSKAFRVTIVAHSMGTIVANQLIRRSPDFLYDEIVYMGAACTIQQFADTTLVYVKENPATRFHNLCLHPIEEANDRYGYGVLPFGSLLDWIDNYITDRKSALDGTLGKWENVMKVLPVVDYLRTDVRRRIFVKGFGRGDDVPRDHGDFNDPEYDWWDPAFWQLPPESP